MPLSFTRTLRLKVKQDAHSWLNAAATEVNQVWNHCNATAREQHRPFMDDYGTLVFPRRLSGFDLCNRTTGTTAFMARIGADTIQRICTEYGAKLKAAFPKQCLSWRASRGARRSLGWVPFKAASIKRKGNALRFCGKIFRVFDREYLGEHKFKDGCFAQDSVGDWWLCVPVAMQADAAAPMHEAVGIDLGCKDAAVTSEGERLESGHYRKLEAKIAQAQRRGHKKQAKRLHRKAANQRRDAQHKFSTMLVRRYGQIFVGDVSSSKLVKTRMAKSVLDAGWGMLKTQLEYKSQQAAREFQVVDERFTTRVCGNCGALTGPKGVGQLVVRQWECADCGAAHDRDVNAARNILTVGLRCRASVRGNESSSLRQPSSRTHRPRETGPDAARTAA